MDEKRPTWSGKLLDANGRTGTIEVDAGELAQGQEARGTWRVRLAERDGPHVDFRGEVALREEEGRLLLKSSQQLKEGRAIEWEARLEREQAGRYARSAMLGEYRLQGGGPEIPLTRGVMVLWQFA